VKNIIYHNDPKDPLFGTTTEVDTPDPPTSPLLLSKTAFQDYAVSQLGGGMTGMARFQAIMDGCAAGTGAVKFCFSRYEAAQTFLKTAVDQFTQIMVAANPPVMTADERAAIIGNWPEG
jgi:hypothetical protein